MHFNHFSKDLMGVHVWRQTQTQSTILNFYEEDMNILNPHRNERGNGDGLFRMEFPLMQWLVAGVYTLFGNHLILSRLFMFIIGLFSVLGMYRLLEFLFRNETLALIGAWAFNFSPCFYYYTINPLPDNLALCFSIWGVALFFFWHERGKTYLLMISGFLLSAGALCKLPFILYFSVPLSFFILNSIRNGINSNDAWNVLCASVFILLPVAWYFSVIPQWTGNGIVRGIFDSNASPFQFLDYLWHNLVSALPELMLNYGSVLFFLSGFYFIYRNRVWKNPLFGVIVAWSMAILAYFIFEIHMIAKIHDYYLFPFYPMLFILVAYGAWNLLALKIRYLKYLVILCLLILPLTAYLRMEDRWNAETPGFNKDLLVYSEELRNAAPKDALCIVGNDVSHYIYFYYIDKKGWAFQDNNISAKRMNEMIRDGARYLYSDSRQIENDSSIFRLLDKLILEKGSFRVYRLKEVNAAQRFIPDS
ncbi:MAG: glycosyltransferase family 39 protein [Chitinophagaceae bacterium]|nr:glycosyltransferase family 39 protein [Chitinophagaceae bacterium]